MAVDELSERFAKLEHPLDDSDWLEVLRLARPRRRAGMQAAGAVAASDAPVAPRRASPSHPADARAWRSAHSTHQLPLLFTPSVIASRKAARALLRVAATVPSLMPTTSAISGYERSAK